MYLVAFWHFHASLYLLHVVGNWLAELRNSPSRVSHKLSTPVQSVMSINLVHNQSSQNKTKEWVIETTLNHLVFPQSLLKTCQFFENFPILATGGYFNIVFFFFWVGGQLRRLGSLVLNFLKNLKYEVITKSKNHPTLICT
jgi:hypothetical protein